jgi:hypothetical protein
VLTFLDATLERDTTARDLLASAHRDAPLGPGPHVEFAAAGATAPAPWEPGSTVPPTPRQFRPLLAALGGTETAALLEFFHPSHPAAPIFHPVFAFALIYELSVERKDDDARALGAVWRRLVPDLVDTFVALGDHYSRDGQRGEYAARCYSSLLLFDPDNAAARRKLAALQK